MFIGFVVSMNCLFMFLGCFSTGLFLFSYSLDEGLNVYFKHLLSFCGLPFNVYGVFGIYKLQISKKNLSIFS